MDASAYENATVIHDLNIPIGSDYNNAFDVIYDGGTLEHVFDTKQALENIIRMVKPGGIIIHALPVNNYINHGFFQFSPTLFFDFYLANGFSILEPYVIEPGSFVRKTWRVYKVHREMLEMFHFGRTPIVSYFVVKKENDVSSIVIPQQSSYAGAWGKAHDKKTIKKPKSAFKKTLEKMPLYPFFRHIVRKYIQGTLRYTKNSIKRLRKNRLPVYKRV